MGYSVGCVRVRVDCECGVRRAVTCSMLHSMPTACPLTHPRRCHLDVATHGRQRGGWLVVPGCGETGGSM
jgi:hypothetical protein